MTAEPMLPVGQKMRRISDGQVAEVLASGEDWAIIRPGRWPKALRPGVDQFVVEMASPERRWLPVVGPATWDVWRDGHGIYIVPESQGPWAVQIDSDYLPDHIDADDLAHRIADILEMWDEDHVLFAAEHREAQTAREATS